MLAGRQRKKIKREIDGERKIDKEKETSANGEKQRDRDREIFLLQYVQSGVACQTDPKMQRPLWSKVVPS